MSKLTDYWRGVAFFVFLMLFSTVLFPIVLGVALGIMQRTVGVDADALFISPWFQVWQQLVRLILPLFLWGLICKQPILPTIPLRPLRTKVILLICGLSLAVQPPMMFISGISGLFFTNNVSDIMTQLAAQPLWLLIFAFAITPAVCEEVVFRGYLQTQLRRPDIKRTALLGALMFALIHMDPQQFLYAFAMGIIFVLVTHYTRSVWAAVLLHFLINAMQVWLMRIATTVYTDEAAEELTRQEQVQGVLAVGVIAVFLLPLTVLILRKIARVCAGDGGEYDPAKITTHKNEE